MKMLTFSLLFICLYCTSARAQTLTLTVDSYSHDSTYSTGFDTLNAVDPADPGKKSDRVVGVKSIHKGVSKYWLFFYFSTSDITQKNVKISNKNFAYFILNNNQYLRFPYSGRPVNYTAKDDAGFFIDITNAIGRLQSAKILSIRFETSTLYHEIKIPPKRMSGIADIVNRLVE